MLEVNLSTYVNLQKAEPTAIPVTSPDVTSPRGRLQALEGPLAPVKQRTLLKREESSPPHLLLHLLLPVTSVWSSAGKFLETDLATCHGQLQHLHVPGESSRSVALPFSWRNVGVVKALALPMVVTVTKYQFGSPSSPCRKGLLRALGVTAT
ncbi:hypothetical protein DPEC_G00274330 [Dallia pectoralis]|uniref:Uncharacterized protein n=1 Tax=Dallia pectoralis TaxID=75939 RepID=A0ACC2FL52_DALPE|nr:hypothetical protein DPEC_G00274330 [Dallia pectoralis]